jgi:hypothetical protein
MRTTKVRKLIGHSAMAAMLAGLTFGCTPAGSQTGAAALAEIGCNFQSKKVCEQALAHPINYASGIRTSNQSYFQQNQLATAWEQVPVKAPGGSEVDVQCQVNTQNNTVVYAYATPSGTVSDSDLNWLKQVGLCAGDASSEPEPKIRAED